jgi:adenylate cyclase
MDALGSSDVFLFDEFYFDRRVGDLFRRTEDGSLLPISIGSRALTVLGVLINRPGALVSKDEIMTAAWPETVVEEANLSVQISTLRRILDLGRPEGSCIQTVSGRGYRFVPRVTRPDGASPGPAPVFGLDPITPPEATSPARTHRPTWRWLAAGSGLVAIAALTFAMAWYGGLLVGPRAPPRLSIVVLPFENLGGDPKDDYLADGITEDVTTDLSHIPGMLVIARQSAYTYKGKAVDVRKVGEELGVRYVLEGSIRKLGDTIRVNAQLIATETGGHLWAGRFDQQLKDVSAGQEEIVRRIGQTMNVALLDIESARSTRERPTSPDAFDLLTRARSMMAKPSYRKNETEILTLFERSLQLDPSSVQAMLGIAWVLLDQMDEYPGRGGTERAAKLISDARSIDPSSERVLILTTKLLEQKYQFTAAIEAARRTIEAYPNNVSAHQFLAYCTMVTGHADQAVSLYDETIRLDPRSPNLFHLYAYKGLSLFLIGRDEEAAVWLQKAVDGANLAPASPLYRAMRYSSLAATHARLGHSDEAHRAIAEAQRIWPYLTVRSRSPEDLSSPVFVAQFERYQAALRLAGQRDHAEEDADFGVASDDRLHEDLAGLTPTTVPGAATIRTAELERLLADRKPIVIDPLTYFWGRSLPGAVGLRDAGWGGSTSDTLQDRLREKVQALAKGDFATPIIAVGWNSERFDGRNLALRLAALGYTQVYWYRGGREAWEVNGLPETMLDVQEW